MRRAFLLTAPDGTALTIKEWAERLGISYHAMRFRYAKYNDDPCIFRYGLFNHIGPLKPRELELVIGGETHSKEEWERITGIPWRTLTGRRSRNLPLEQIISKKRLTTRVSKKLITFNNRTHSQAEWAGILGISRERVRQRLRKYSIEEALGMVKHKQKHPFFHKTYRGKPTKRMVEESGSEDHDEEM